MIRRSDTKRLTLPAVEFTSSLVSVSVAAPGWADAKPYAGIAEDSTYRATFVRDTRHFALVLDEPQSDARESEPASAMLSIGGVQSASAFDGKSSGHSVILSEFSQTSALPPFSMMGKTGVAMGANTTAATGVISKIRAERGQFLCRNLRRFRSCS
jgi:hypothetical protein